MTRSTNRTYLPQLDQLRGLACLLVISYHGFQIFGAQLAHGIPFDPAKDWIVTYNPVFAVIEEGHTGVGLFIVLSGFVLSIGTIGNEVIYSRFLHARILRIYPVMLCVVAAGATARPVGLLAVIGTLLPIPSVPALDSNMTAMTWAVSVELLCYLIFPFLLRFSAVHRIRALLSIALLVIVLRTLAVLGDGANPRDISYWTILGRLDQFCIGMATARLYVVHRWHGHLPGWALIPAGIVVFSLLMAFNQAGGWPVISLWKLLWPTVEATAWAAFILCSLVPATGAFLQRFTLLIKLGVISYPLYLLHFAVLYACLRNGLLLTITGQPYVDALITTMLVAIPIALGLAMLAHRAIEQPFLAMRPRYVPQESLTAIRDASSRPA